MYSAKILADSIAHNGKRLTTMEISYPRFVHAELLTHRAMSRNSVSSRAIPQKKLKERITKDPAMPVWWGKNQKGMQAREELGASAKVEAQAIWLEARDAMIGFSDRLAALGLHKQIANRLLEPWMYITVILSATEWDNFFFLRVHPDAQPEIAHVARMMKEGYIKSKPRLLAKGEWHLPLVSEVEKMEYSFLKLRQVSTGRCARVSYLTHEGIRDFEADLTLHARLLKPGTVMEPQHLSPFEHVATPADDAGHRGGNFYGWKQYRQLIERPIPQMGGHQ